MGRMRYTKTYPDGMVTIDSSQFHVNQEVIDSNIRNSEPIKAAVKRLSELENRNEPKTLTYEGDGYDDEGRLIYDTAYCPRCEAQFEVDYCGKPKYCPKCGQALDWSEA